jgi:hypothetical protein
LNSVNPAVTKAVKMSMPVYKLGVNYDGENKMTGIGIPRFKHDRTQLYPKFTSKIKAITEMPSKTPTVEPFIL